MNPYAILDLPRDATTAQVRAAWRAAAKSLHPDHHQKRPAAEREALARRYDDARAAFELLTDPARRSRYDRGQGARRPVDLPYLLTRDGGRVDVEVTLEGARVVTLDVPRGARPGYQWDFGDVVVELRHAQVWVRKGWDLHGFLRVTLADVIAGAEMMIDTPHGAAAVSLPPRDLKPLRIKGYGHRLPGTDAGDLVVELDIAWPVLDAAALGELRRASGVNS